MKKHFYFVFMLLTLYNAAAQDNSSVRTRVSVTPLVCDTSDQTLLVASRTVLSTLELALRMTGEYDVFMEDDPAIPDNLFMFCEKKGIPNLICGKSYYSDSGEIVFELSVYNIEINGFSVMQKEISPTVLDVFETAEKLALSLAESFSGMKMAFGSVRLVNIGDKGSYRVRIGESVITPESDFLGQVLAGKRDVEIIQDRMFGQYTVVTYPVEIIENETMELVFFIPGFTDDEGKIIREKEAEIRKNLSSFFKKTGREKALEIYNELIETDFAQTGYSESAAEKKNELIRQRDELLAEAGTR